MKTRTIDIPEFDELDEKYIELSVLCGVNESDAAILYGIMAFPDGISQKNLVELAEVTVNDLAAFQTVKEFKNLYIVEKVTSGGRGRPSNLFKGNEDCNFIDDVCGVALNQKKILYEIAYKEFQGQKKLLGEEI